MTKVKTKSEQEFDRTEILRYLNECGLQPVTPKSILIYLDDCLRPVSLRRRGVSPALYARSRLGGARHREESGPAGSHPLDPHHRQRRG